MRIVRARERAAIVAQADMEDNAHERDAASRYERELKLDLNAARMFVTVVQVGSLSAAADRLGIPLSTLSRRIRQLERQLNVQLLERSVRGTALTHAGTRLYEYASRGVETLVEGEQAVMSDQQQQLEP